MRLHLHTSHFVLAKVDLGIPVATNTLAAEDAHLVINGAHLPNLVDGQPDRARLCVFLLVYALVSLDLVLGVFGREVEGFGEQPGGVLNGVGCVD